MANELERLQRWYSSQCNGDWEHTYGVFVENLDNPGWTLKVELTDTDLEESAFSPVDFQRSETDWVHCKVDKFVFFGAGGAHNLTELLSIFLDWAETQSDDDA